jgi:hypothetical protein
LSAILEDIMVKLIKEIDAVQWSGEEKDLPEDFHLCQPEVHWSAGRRLVYFTFADLHPRHWIEFAENPIIDGKTHRYVEIDGEKVLQLAEAQFAAGGVRVARADGTEYWRETFPFVFYSVKSESSVTRDHRAVYMDRTDEALVRAFVDFIYLEKWTNPLPPRAEFRVIDGSYGRGFRPYYLSPGDWLLKEPHEDGTQYRVVSNEVFEGMRSA